MCVQAEELRRRAAAETQAGVPGREREDVSGTAAAFHGGQDAEPHQGMEYTATLPTGAGVYVFCSFCLSFFLLVCKMHKIYTLTHSLIYPRYLCIYTSRAPPPPGAGTAPVPMAAVASAADLTAALGKQTKEEWRAMALASGWSPEFQKKKAMETAFGSLFLIGSSGVKVR